MSMFKPEVQVTGKAVRLAVAITPIAAKYGDHGEGFRNLDAGSVERLAELLAAEAVKMRAIERAVDP